MRKRKNQVSDTPPDFLDPEQHEEKEVEVNVTTVTRNYFRKLNMSAHGGKQFETVDLGETLTATVGEGQTAKEVGHALHQLAMTHIEEDVAAFDKLAAEDQPVKREKAKDELKVSNDELVEIRDLIQHLLAAKSMKDLAVLQEEIKQRQDLNPTQLAYLREKFNAKAKAFKDVSTKS